MGHSWELSDDLKKDVQERQREVGAQYNPETGRKWGETENTGDNEDVEGMEGRETRGPRKGPEDDQDIR